MAVQRKFRSRYKCWAATLFLISTLTMARVGLAQETPEGYLAAVYSDGSFIAVGTKGRADLITLDKKRVPLQLPTQADLLDVCADGHVILICGRNGTILYSHDGNKFERCDISCRTDIFSVAASNGLYIAGSEQGLIFVSADGMHWTATRLPTENDIVSVAADNQYFMLITKETDVFVGFRGQNWKQINFNEEYAGYYKPQTFSKVLNIGSAFFVVGQPIGHTASPLIMSTELGDVWIPITLMMINGEPLDTSSKLEIRSLSHDSQDLVAVCNQGRLLKISECVTCHKLYDLSEVELTAMVYGNGHHLVVGQDFYYDVFKSETIQYRIQTAQAFQAQKNGAIVIDVRTAHERETNGYIPGSIHIPIAEVRERLPGTVPGIQSPVIFYCSRGGRAQQAAEIALELGYELVFYLHEIDHWPVALTNDDI